ncbi:MAG: hypothetical protein MUO58_08555 [Anaerolineales bacterium]|nr:hypothetical protein [Anaerolineales bacterium]
MRILTATHRRWSNRVAAVSSIFAGFGVAHLIDDFLYGVPAEFNLSNPPTQFLALASSLRPSSKRGYRDGPEW